MKHVDTPYRGFVSIEHWQAPNVSHPFEVVRSSDSVVICIYDAVNDRVLLVEQQRASMIREDNPNGRIIELIAGRFDKALGPIPLAIAEAMEEAGITLRDDQVELINDGIPMTLSAGVLSERAYGMIAVIHPDQIADGDEGYGVDEGEDITRIWMSTDEFIAGPHHCWRVWAFAQYIARRRAEQQ
jgi:8-oxo-dGTP pyrophosphatase MutT (NUDIX family)